MSNGVLAVTVHPGIGDISWAYSKLINTGRKLDLTICEDRKTKRALSYVNVLPTVESARYGTMQDYNTLAKSWNGTWEDVQKAEQKGKKLFLSVNNWLSKGNRLEGWMPDLPANFHYDLFTRDEDKITAKRLLPENGMKYCGIYTASVGGNKAWHGWEPEEWHLLMKKIAGDFPQTTFVLIGARWDMDYHRLLMPFMQEFSYIDLFGKTPDMSLTVEVLKRLDYLLGFASGIPILSNVLGKQECMFYPYDIHRTMYSWPCPLSLATGAHKPLLWDRPYNIYRKITPQLEKYLGGD